jgi:hypothetical protein
MYGKFGKLLQMSGVWNLREHEGKLWVGLFWLRIELDDGFCKHKTQVLQCLTKTHTVFKKNLAQFRNLVLDFKSQLSEVTEKNQTFRSRQSTTGLHLQKSVTMFRRGT